MEITKIAVKKVNKEDSKLRGFATVILDDAIAIHNIKILEGKEKLFIAFPSSKSSSDDKYYDIVHPIKQDIRILIEESILKNYGEVK